MRIIVFSCLTLIFISLRSNAQITSGEDKSRYQTALEKYRESNYPICIEICDEIIRRAVRDSEVYKLKARAHTALGELVEAESEYNEALQDNKHDPNLFFERGKVRLQMKRFDKAELDFIDARRIYKDQISPEAEMFAYLEEMGHAQHYKGSYKNAIDTYTKAIYCGSSQAIIDLMSAYLQTNAIFDLKVISDTILSSEKFYLKSDSSVYNYISALNDISNYRINTSNIYKINNAIKNYYECNRNGFCGFLNDLLYAKYKLQVQSNQDTLAYRTIKQVFADNEANLTMKSKVEDLKRKLGIDSDPPIITILNPVVDNMSTASVKGLNDKLEIYGRITDASGITELTLNNKPIYTIESDGIFITRIELHPGRNLLKFNAVDKEENKSTKTFIINFEDSPVVDPITNSGIADSDIPEINENTQNYAVLIAEKDYDDPNFVDLTAPISDADDLKNILVGKYDFTENNVIMLNNSKREVIIDTLDKIYKMLSDNDNLLVFYAGHGDIKKKDNTIIGGYIVPSDAIRGNQASYISSEDIFASISTSQARHILFIVDACFGGSLMRSSVDNAPQHIKNYFSLKSRNILTSGNIEEVPDQGKFIQNVKAFLRFNDKKFVTALDLYTYIVNNTEKSNTPQFGQIKGSGDTGGKFIFVQKKE